MSLRARRRGRRSGSSPARYLPGLRALRDRADLSDRLDRHADDAVGSTDDDCTGRPTDERAAPGPGR
jgi:hypothetical protein